MPKRNLEPLPSPPLKRKRRILHSYYCSAMRMFDVEGYPMSARSTQKSFAKTCMISQALFFVTKNINFIWLNIQRVCVLGTSDPGLGIGVCAYVTKLRFVSLRYTRLHGVLHNPPSPTNCVCVLLYLDALFTFSKVVVCYFFLCLFCKNCKCL